MVPVCVLCNMKEPTEYMISCHSARALLQIYIVFDSPNRTLTNMSIIQATL